MARQGAAEATILQALQDESSARCDPPLDEVEILKIVQAEVSFETEERGSRDASFNRIKRYQEKCARFRLLSDTDVENLESPPWLIDGLFHIGARVVLFGPSGVGKSFLALDWALSIAVGQEWLGRPVRQGPVVYVVAEGLAGFQVRLLAWKQAHGKEGIPEVRFIGEAVSLLNEDEVQALLDVLRELTPRPILVVLDTLSRCIAGGDENSSKDMGLVVQAVDRICKELGATVMPLHHQGKKGSSERGHSLLRCSVETMILLEESNGNTKLLSCEKQKDAEAFAPIALSFDLVELPDVAGSLVVRAAPELDPWAATALTASQSKALEVLKALNGDASSHDWLTACSRSSIPADTFYKVVRGLCEKGHVTRVGKGKTARYRVGELSADPTATAT